MQHNVHLERFLRRLSRAVRRLGKPGAQVVLDAADQRFDDRHEAEGPSFNVRIPAFHLGEIAPFTREDLYGERGFDTEPAPDPTSASERAPHGA
jgi:hypothetical protein